MSGIRIDLSSPEAESEFRSIVEEHINQDGSLSAEKRHKLEAQAQALGVHALDIDKIFGEFAQFKSSTDYKDIRRMNFENIIARQIILSVPVNTDRTTRKNLCRYLKKSGIEVLRTVVSPVLAALGYCYSFNKEGFIFVFELEEYSIDFASIEADDHVYQVSRADHIDMPIDEHLCQEKIKKLFEEEITLICENDFVKNTPKTILICGKNKLTKAITSTLGQNFNGEIVLWNEKQEASEIGAAIQLEILKGKLRDILLLDCIPFDLGIKIGETFEILIERNTSIPTRKSELFTPTTSDNQTEIEIVLLEGNSFGKMQNEIIGGLKFSELPSLPKGEAKIEITIDIDTNSDIKLFCKSLDNGKEKILKI